LIIKHEKNHLYIIPSPYFCHQESSAQGDKWTLEDCINYAVKNNIGLKRQRLQTETAEVNLLKSKMNLLPSLNLGSDVSIQYGRSIDPISNGVTFLQNFRNGYQLSSGITLFSGFANINTISAYKFMLKAGLENEKIVRKYFNYRYYGQYYRYFIQKDLRMPQRCNLISQRNSFSELRKWWRQ